MLKAVSFASLLLGATISCAHAQASSQKTAEAESRTRPGVADSAEGQASVTIRHKLASIIIPNVEFHSTTLSDAIEYLRQESRRLDTDPDPDARGMNIFLKLPAASRPTALSPDVGHSESVSILPSANTRVTLTLSHVPLLEVLKYLATQAGLKVRVEPYAVSFVPLAEDTDPLITAVFRVPPTMISNQTSTSGATALDQPATASH